MHENSARDCVVQVCLRPLCLCKDVVGVVEMGHFVERGLQLFKSNQNTPNLTTKEKFLL